MKSAKYFFYAFVLSISIFLPSCSTARTPVQVSNSVQTLIVSAQHSPTPGNTAFTETPYPLPLAASPTPTIENTRTLKPAPTSRPTITPLSLATIAADAEGELVFLDIQEYQKTKLMKVDVDKNGRAKNQEPLLITDALPNYAVMMSGISDIFPSPDGNKIFSEFLTEGPSYLSFDIPSGKIDHPYFGDAYFVGWYPDSKGVLMRDHYRGVWSSDVAGSPATPVAKIHKEFDQVVVAAVSPDGKQVVYSYKNFQPYNIELWLSGIGGEDDRKLFDTRSLVLYLAWSPDGTMIAYYDDGYWVMNADGTDRRKLSNMPQRRSLPILWSPDSQMLLVDYGNYVDSLNMDFASSNIFLIDVKSGETRTILPSGSKGHLYPACSPDGQKIAFISVRGGKPDIWVINRDGTDLHQVTHAGRQIRYLFWRKP